ncbi:translation elongation factor Ts [Dissulfurirhabdus thermomarina]|uniref:Elongation factor Ts n=1 Tax=Dissulfurirhabdus thermomarina TaxID=1765737 RepID=A0A6N9TRS0_DISTH|nr:translation elongation factor Ts [Dissulfurirhabdus thermomarina]NDY43130.1 translation elongation factor Ts [Dissulfurirhabdus thermomarina]NMX23569.1 translation elongation factor Ts [Dissulfurirhabdus thermomarina]
MAQITAAMVKELRERTNAGMMDCKKALQECGGDMEKAVQWLRQKGLAVAAKRAGRSTSEGVIQCYVHAGNKMAAMVEVNCETDFVAKTDQFVEFARELAMHVAATNPVCIRREDMPPEVLEREREIFRNQALESGKPEHIVDKIVEGRVEKFYREVCLLEQPFVKDPDVTIQDLLNELVAKMGENISVRRFVRYQVGAEEQ